MNTNQLFFVLLSLGLSLNALSNTENELGLDNPKITPEIVSSSGRTKIKEHLQIIEQNLANTETNVTSTKKNIGVIESELAELEGLLKEHKNLKNRYLEFLGTADKENSKNEKAITEIIAYEKKVEGVSKKTQDPTRLAELEAAKSERAQREDWRKETQQKMVKIRELLAGVEKNLQSIESRKAPLVEQLQNWNGRLRDYEGMLAKLNQKKQDAERFIASQKKVSP